VPVPVKGNRTRRRDALDGGGGCHARALYESIIPRLPLNFL
jgi:hypothetical protein